MHIVRHRRSIGMPHRCMKQPGWSEKLPEMDFPVRPRMHLQPGSALPGMEFEQKSHESAAAAFAQYGLEDAPSGGVILAYVKGESVGQFLPAGHDVAEAVPDGMLPSL